MKEIFSGTHVKLDLCKRLGVMCSSVIHTNASEKKDHTQHENRYESNYGTGWEAQMTKKMHQQGQVSVTDLDTHIVRQSKAVDKDTKYKDIWLFYHDTLSLMTTKETVSWMKTQEVREGSDVTFHDKWILPQNELNSEYKRFKNRPIGNSPEMMSLDNRLNRS